MPAGEASNPDALAQDVRRWLADFQQALERGDADAVAALFHAESHWRDVLAFTWHLRTVSGGGRLAQALVRNLDQVRPSGFRIAEGRTPPRRMRRASVEAVEAIFAFETAFGRGSGVLRLTPDAGGAWRAWTLLTLLDELKGFEERTGARRPKGESYSRDFGGENWLDKRNRERAYADRDPTVLVVGGGQAGLAAAARLRALGVDALIVDRMERVGDNWRKRYHALTLHNQVHVNHLPYMPYPETWPVYIPKDMLANWFEAYVDALELNFWTGTEFLGGSYDEAERRWTVRLRRADGSDRIMRPSHVVMATGTVSGAPNIPALPGLDSFKGTVVHSSAYQDGAAWKGRKAIVVGTGNSGHDAAQDLHSAGAEVTMVQRGSTTVVGLEPSGQLIYSVYSEGPPIDDCDLIASSLPYPVLHRAHQLATQEMLKHDRKLLDGLTARGFRHDIGYDQTGFLMKYFRQGGGYYLNVGCSDLIVDGEIGLLQFDEIERCAPEGARLRGGRMLEADLIVLATGYRPQQEMIGRLFGGDVAGRVGPIWDYDPESGEVRNVWKRTAQEGLWFIAGSLAQCRISSRWLALQIKACEEGLIDKAAPPDEDAYSAAAD
jgi:putative flavoprotein involved in K+ transport